MSEQKSTVPSPSPRDDEIAKILAAGEAGVGAATRVVEAAEAHYFSAVAASTEQSATLTTNSAR